MFKRFFLALICAFSFFSVFAEKVDLDINCKNPDIAVYVEKILENDNSIILSDGSFWIIRNINDEDLQLNVFNWRIGDEVRIGERNPEKYQGKYILKNVRNKEILFVDLDKNSINQVYYRIDKIDKNGYLLLVTSDLWSIGYWGAFATCKWKVGDSVIVNKSDYSKSEDYMLINANNSTSAWASLISWK